MAGFDDAIADGVDIITISIGFNYPVDLIDDSIAVGPFHAAQKGILAVNSAGNNGLVLGQITSTQHHGCLPSKEGQQLFLTVHGQDLVTKNCTVQILFYTSFLTICVEFTKFCSKITRC